MSLGTRPVRVRRYNSLVRWLCLLSESLKRLFSLPKIYDLWDIIKQTQNLLPAVRWMKIWWPPSAHPRTIPMPWTLLRRCVHRLCWHRGIPVIFIYSLYGEFEGFSSWAAHFFWFLIECPRLYKSSSVSVWWLNELEGKKWELFGWTLATTDNFMKNHWQKYLPFLKQSITDGEPNRNDEKEPGLKTILHLLGRLWQGHSRNFFGAVSNNQLHFWHFSLVGSLSNLWGPGVLPTYRVSCADNILPFGRRFPVGYKAPKQKHTRKIFFALLCATQTRSGLCRILPPPSPWLITRQVIQAGRRTQAREIWQTRTRRELDRESWEYIHFQSFSANVNHISNQTWSSPHETTSIFSTFFHCGKVSVFEALDALPLSLPVPGRDPWDPCGEGWELDESHCHGKVACAIWLIG